MKPLIVFTGGGTGGHIYPGLAIIAELQKNFNCRVLWVGSKNDTDRGIVESAGVEFIGIRSGKFRRNFSFKNFTDLFAIAAGFFSARKILKKQNPVLVFSKGGFVSVPPVLAAASLNIPVWTHESDFTPGLATKINAHFASKICLSYKKTAEFFKNKDVIITGNPIRSVFYTPNKKNGYKFVGAGENTKILLVLGGSQGAKEVNDLIRESIPELTKLFFVVHQTGAQGGGGEPSQAYKPLAYIKDEMPDILAAASLVIGRSGAGTVWECAAAACPMILIPLSGSGTRGDQVENARFFEEKRAAITLIHPDKNALVEAVLSLVRDDEKLKNMSLAAASIGSMRGTEIIVKNIVSFIQEIT